MSTCTFFGHRSAPKEIKPTLMSALIDLIENKNVLNFYVGNQGSFDQLVKQCLIELKEIYPINYTIVLAYIPKNVTAFENDNYKIQSVIFIYFLQLLYLHAHARIQASVGREGNR